LYRIFPIRATSYDFKARGKLNEKCLRMNLKRERLFRREMPRRELRLSYVIGKKQEERFLSKYLILLAHLSGFEPETF
jgi:hypothetical protein